MPVSRPFCIGQLEHGRVGFNVARTAPDATTPRCRLGPPDYLTLTRHWTQREAAIHHVQGHDMVRRHVYLEPSVDCCIPTRIDPRIHTICRLSARRYHLTTFSLLEFPNPAPRLDADASVSSSLLHHPTLQQAVSPPSRLGTIIRPLGPCHFGAANVMDSS